MAEQAQQEVIGCRENLFEKIDELDDTFVAILDKYIIGKQFEPIPVVEFYYAMNLGNVQTRLDVAPNEKVRVCYLLRRMHYCLSAGQREQWLTAILERLCIKRSTDCVPANSPHNCMR